MSVHTELPADVSSPVPNLPSGPINEVTDKKNGKLANRITTKAIWPDYFARLGQSDAANWQYQGYWRDTVNVWRAYYSLLIRHPVIFFFGLRHVFRSGMYRISDEHQGKRWAAIMSALTPLLMLFTPFISLVTVAIAPRYLKFVKKIPMPPMLQPFKFMGLANYNVMFATMFTLHGYLQYRAGMDPNLALRHSSKFFWRDIFDKHLPEGHHTTEELGVVVHGQVRGELPKVPFVIKPASMGAGSFLRTMTWDDAKSLYICRDPERDAHERTTYTPEQLLEWIDKTYDNAIIEKLHVARKPLPVSSFRVMTINVDGNSELLSAVFLPAPEGSNSTAYFDLDSYLLNYEDGAIGTPIRPQSDGKYTGIPIPEMDGIIKACLHMHNQLYGHVEISWDLILTEEGPVYLEGNVYPPGCDYKLSIFKKYSNYTWLRDKILNALL